MSTGFWKRRARSLLPDSTFWRLALATALTAVLTSAGAMAVSHWLGNRLVHSINEESTMTLLRNAVDLIGRTQVQIHETRNNALNEHRQAVEGALDFAQRLLEATAPVRHPAVAPPPESLDLLNTLAPKHNPAFGILDATGHILVHGDPTKRGLPAAALLNAEGHPLLLEPWSEALRNPRQTHFALSFCDQGQRVSLTGARHLPQWGVTLFSVSPFSNGANGLEEQTRLTVNELRARLNEIVVADSGYLYVFDQHCRMIVHPTLQEGDFASLLLPGTTANMCGALRATAERPWGENRLFYLWDKPSDQGNFTHEKISWCTVEPTTGWIVGVSLYVSELEAPVTRFTATIFLPALGSILLLGLVLALQLRKRLQPIQALSQTCRRVSFGDLDATAPEGVSGEIGRLCWHFNTMIKRIRGLRQRDERRRRELEDLNLNLEKTVLLRTRALERKARKLEEANARLKELDELKTSFVSSVSHELRTPLTSILGFAKLIARDYLRLLEEPELQAVKHSKRVLRILDNLGIISQESERLSRLVNDFLDLAKIEAGRLEWHDGQLDFQELVLDTMAAMRSQLRCKPEVVVRHSIAPDIPAVYADRDRLTQVLVNLLNNALKFTRRGEIRVTACHRDGVLQCRVRDTGCGIRRDELRKIFDKFHQVAGRDARGDKPQGTGLGLAIVLSILEHYQGEIWAESQEGGGAELVMEMPLRLDLERQSAAEAARTRHQAQLRPRRNGRPDPEEAPLVLVVDDEQHVQSLLLHLFQDAGYRVATASDGLQALETAKAVKPDLITMDILMPRMHGSETMERLRATPELADIPVIIVSALADLGADNYMDGDAVLPKPIDEELLLATAQALLLEGDVCPNPRRLPHSAEWSAGKPLLCDKDGNCFFCPVHELHARVALGFTGMIYLPGHLHETLDLLPLVTAPDVQVVML